MSAAPPAPAFELVSEPPASPLFVVRYGDELLGASTRSAMDALRDVDGAAFFARNRKVFPYSVLRRAIAGSDAVPEGFALETLDFRFTRTIQEQ